MSTSEKKAQLKHGKCIRMGRKLMEDELSQLAVGRILESLPKDLGFYPEVIDGVYEGV